MINVIPYPSEIKKKTEVFSNARNRAGERGKRLFIQDDIGHFKQEIQHGQIF